MITNQLKFDTNKQNIILVKVIHRSTYHEQIYPVERNESMGVNLEECGAIKDATFKPNGLVSLRYFALTLSAKAWLTVLVVVLVATRSPMFNLARESITKV